MNQPYPPERYNRHLVLKVPVLLLVAMLYATRHLLIVFLAYSPSPRLASAFAFLRPLAEPWYVAADLPALLVMLAWWQRRPGAHTFWRRTWRLGRHLLTTSLLLQFLLLAHAKGTHLWESYYLTQGERLTIVTLAVDLLLLYYLWRSPNVGDTFADFPTSPRSSQR